MSYVRFYSDASFTLGTNGNTKLWNGTASNAMEYSTDTSTWTSWSGSAAISAAATNGVYNLYLRGTGNTKVSNITSNTPGSTKFIFTGTQPIDSEGNIESLLDYAIVDNNQHPTMDTYAFGYLFYNQTLLRTSPELGSITLADYCYHSMFRACTSLTTAPELPATTLASYCYYYMFYGCTSLTTAPKLPATTLTSYCYYHMFYGCTSLTIPPKLPATTLANYCYYYMFYGCTSLMIPPELPATILADYCYYRMFRGCTSLTIPPELPATTLVTYCYYQMFRNSGIELSTTQTSNYTLAYRIPTVGTGITASNALTDMFYGSGINTPSINTTYYVKDPQYKSNQIELGLVAQAIRDKTETSSSLTFPEDYITEINNIMVDIDDTYLISQAVPSDALGADGDICVVYN